jgi:hypothetical protein
MERARLNKTPADQRLFELFCHLTYAPDDRVMLARLYMALAPSEQENIAAASHALNQLLGPVCSLCATRLDPHGCCSQCEPELFKQEG